MKTLEQIQKHLMEYPKGYNRDDANLISGFLMGIGLKSHSQKLTYHKGNGTFEEFMDWFNTEELPKGNLTGRVLQTDKSYFHVFMALCEPKNGVVLGYNGQFIRTYNLEDCQLCNKDREHEFREGMKSAGFYFKECGTFGLCDAPQEKEKEIKKRIIVIR